MSFADVDNDGDQDVYVQMGGSYIGDKINDALFENPGFGMHWISIALVGRRSNRSAIGARIHVKIIENGKLRSVFRQVNSGGSFGCNPLRQYIGMGNAERIESVEIYWPTTDRPQTFDDLAMDQWGGSSRVKNRSKPYTSNRMSLVADSRDQGKGYGLRGTEKAFRMND